MLSCSLGLAVVAREHSGVVGVAVFKLATWPALHDATTNDFSMHAD